MATDERNKALAEMIGPAGYEAAERCPLGHDNLRVITSECDTGDPCWAEDDTWDVGILCLTCIVEDTRNVHWTVDRIWEYSHAESLRKEHQSDPAWHPEWRIPQQPKDFSRPGVLEPLAVDIIKRWVDRWGLNKDKVGYSIEQRSLAPYKEITVCLAAMSPMGDYIIGFGRGASYEEALGEAMLSDHRTLNDPHR